MPNQIPIRAASPLTSRVPTTIQRDSPGFGMRHAAPAAARATEPHPESARLRGLAHLSKCPRHHFAVSALPDILSRPSTAVHRELLVGTL